MDKNQSPISASMQVLLPGLKKLHRLTSIDGMTCTKCTVCNVNRIFGWSNIFRSYRNRNKIVPNLTGTNQPSLN